MALYLGVDGGGTKTQALLANFEDGKGFSLVGAASNPNSVGWESARDTVLNLIETTLQNTSISKSSLSGICIGMAGIDRFEQIERMKFKFKVEFPDTPIEIVNDALPALTAGTMGESGVVLIAGTGSICVGEDKQGRTMRAGGFGHLIGDEGSGFDIGRQGIMAAIQAAEGRGPKTELWAIVMERFEVRSVSEMISKIYESPHPVGTIASFAKTVVTASEHDPVAFNIIDSATIHHERLVVSVFERITGPISKTVVLSGGLFINTDKLKRRLEEKLDQYQLSTLAIAPVAGAVLRAMRATGKLTPESISTWKRWLATMQIQRNQNK